MRQIAIAIIAQHGHGQRLAAQQLQGVGNIAGAAAKVAAQGGHQERYVQNVDLLGHDLVGKAAVKGHDVVERK
ncbi:hypothetical protein D3C71_1879620 [compost metagenome]